MNGEVSSNDFEGEPSGMSCDEFLIEKCFDQLSKDVSNLIHSNKEKTRATIRDLEKQQKRTNEKLRDQKLYKIKICLIFFNPNYESFDVKYTQVL